VRAREDYKYVEGCVMLDNGFDAVVGRPED
jgi:hypothetical protein